MTPSKWLCFERPSAVLRMQNSEKEPSWITETKLTLQTVKSSHIQHLARRFDGLKFNLKAYTCTAAVVLLINIAWLVWAKLRYGLVAADSVSTRFNHQNPVYPLSIDQNAQYLDTIQRGLGYGEIFFGDCSRANLIDTCLHLAINALSTFLLSGSNTFLAVYCSPTREEVDRAHRKKKWLHIGLHSPKNLIYISKRKTFVCFLLALTSIPFNLIYNSLIFTSTSATEYRWAVVTSEFLQGAAFVLKNEQERPALKKIQDEASTYEKLNNATCISTYSNQLLSNRRNVILVSENAHRPGNSILAEGYAALTPVPYEINEWMCDSSSLAGGICNPSSQFANVSDFVIAHHNISYCLSEAIEATCSVRFSWNIMVLTLVCNVVKLVIMVLIVIKVDAAKLLVTVGDAMSSFMRTEDHTTAGRCLMSIPSNDSPFLETENHTPAGRCMTTMPSGPSPWKDAATPQPFCSGNKSSGSGVTKWLWLRYSILVSIWVFVGLLCLLQAVAAISSKSASISSLGFGKLSALALVFPASSKVILNINAATIFANAPQLVLSVTYLMYQNIMSSIYIVRDWHNFAFTGQGLMVSSPEGNQRGHWMLGIPFVPGLVIQASQFLFHWLVSQALFPVRVKLYTANGTPFPPGEALNNCGYSPIAIILSIVAACGLFINVWYKGHGWLDPDGPPAAATCSAAISAACHVRTATQAEAEYMVYEKLRWGAVGEPSDAGVGHCTFAPAAAFEAGRMRKPEKGKLYA